MYGISVPVMVENVIRYGKEKTLDELRRFDASRVFLALGTYRSNPEEQRQDMENLRLLSDFFRENGLETGAWIWTFMCNTREMGFSPMVGIDGNRFESYACPDDTVFSDFAYDYLREIAKTGVDIIMYDDDFRYGFLGSSPACLCEKHIERINRITGEPKTREALRKYIETGSKNKFRDAYLQANGEAFADFARKMRSAVDSVDPEIRLGMCSCLTSWDIDGITPDKLSKILAGNTKPFVRLIGAPYWAVNRAFGGMRLNDVIELERMESSWTRNAETEILSEGDAYPRPRTACPSSFVEGFDTALRASGCTDGILKYGIDYNSALGYETGYALHHEHNRKLYGEIDELFRNTTPCGVRIYEFPQKLSLMEVPTETVRSVNIQELFYSPASRLLSHNGIPSVYSGEGTFGVCFGENARQISDEALSHGMIIDTPAAEILMSRGYDVGIRKINGIRNVTSETFEEDGNRIVFDAVNAYDIETDEKAIILSRASDSGIPISFRYEDGEGRRFLVLNIDPRLYSRNDGILKHYARGLQTEKNALWLSGRKIPATCTCHPSLYLQSAGNNGRLAVGIWNYYEDPVFSPVVSLGEEYSSAVFYNCTGKLEGDKVILSDIAPYGFAGVEVIK